MSDASSDDDLGVKEAPPADKTLKPEKYPDEMGEMKASAEALFDDDDDEDDDDDDDDNEYPMSSPPQAAK